MVEGIARAVAPIEKETDSVAFLLRPIIQCYTLSASNFAIWIRSASESCRVPSVRVARPGFARRYCTAELNDAQRTSPAASVLNLDGAGQQHATRCAFTSSGGRWSSFSEDDGAERQMTRAQKASSMLLSFGRPRRGWSVWGETEDEPQNAFRRIGPECWKLGCTNEDRTTLCAS